MEDFTTVSAGEIFHEQQWKTVAIDVVGIGSGDTDVAVLASRVRVGQQCPLQPTSSGLLYGQKFYFLGYPHGLDSGGEDINAGFSLPFVKSGRVSAFPEGDLGKIYLDAHGNPGFSGGPVVFSKEEKQPPEFLVAGVYVGHLIDPVMVVDRDGSPIGKCDENQGIGVAIAIESVTELIDANPIGLPLT